MPITFGEGGGGEFLTAPDGMQQAVFVDYVITEGVVKTFEGRSKTVDTVKLVFLAKRIITEKDYADQGIEVFQEMVGLPFKYQDTPTLSSGEGSNLFGYMTEWHAINKGEQFDTWEEKFESLLGRNALLNIVHESRKTGRVWPKIRNINPLMDGMEPMAIPPTYVREKDREPDTSFNHGANVEAPEGAE